MLKSRKNTKEMEGIVSVFERDCGEVLAESLVARCFCGLGEGGLAEAVEKLKGGFLLYLTTGEIEGLKERIELEGGEEPKSEGGIDGDD